MPSYITNAETFYIQTLSKTCLMTSCFWYIMCTLLYWNISWFAICYLSLLFSIASKPDVISKYYSLYKYDGSEGTLPERNGDALSVRDI